jgi:hypothetical protein
MPVPEPAHPTPDPAPAAEQAAPPNRAARRAKATQVDPGHVGPRPGRTGQGRPARSHTKRSTS